MDWFHNSFLIKLNLDLGIISKILVLFILIELIKHKPIFNIFQKKNKTLN
jgi:hypothetical protein